MAAHSALGALALLGFATAFGITWTGLSNLIALRTHNSELTMVGGLLFTLPISFLTPAFSSLAAAAGMAPRGVSNVNPAAYVIETGQRLMSTGNSWAPDGRTLIALAVTAPCSSRRPSPPSEPRLSERESSPSRSIKASDGQPSAVWHPASMSAFRWFSVGPDA